MTEGSIITVLAIVPPLQEGHKLTLLRRETISALSDHMWWEQQDREDLTVHEAEHGFGLNEVFTFGPLFGTRIRMASAREQALYLAPRLTVADAAGSLILDAEQSMFLNYIYQSVIIDGEFVDELYQAVSIVGGDAIEAHTFCTIYRGATAVVILEEPNGSYDLGQRFRYQSAW